MEELNKKKMIGKTESQTSGKAMQQWMGRSKYKYGPRSQEAATG